MDCLNDRLSKKDLGAFYTPIPYARKAAELEKRRLIEYLREMVILFWIDALAQEILNQHLLD